MIDIIYSQSFDILTLKQLWDYENPWQDYPVIPKHVLKQIKKILNEDLLNGLFPTNNYIQLHIVSWLPQIWYTTYPNILEYKWDIVATIIEILQRLRLKAKQTLNYDYVYSEEYNSIYKQLYNHLFKKYNYTSVYPDGDAILEPLPPINDITNQFPKINEILQNILWVTIEFKPQIIHPIANIKGILWLAYPLTVCTRIKDKRLIPVTIIHELLHNAFRYNKLSNTIKEYWKKHNLTEKEAEHMIIFAVTDKLYPDTAWYWKSIKEYEKLAFAYNNIV